MVDRIVTYMGASFPFFSDKNPVGTFSGTVKFRKVRRQLWPVGRVVIGEKWRGSFWVLTDSVITDRWTLTECFPRFVRKIGLATIYNWMSFKFLMHFECWGKYFFWMNYVYLILIFFKNLQNCHFILFAGVSDWHDYSQGYIWIIFQRCGQLENIFRWD